MTQRRILSKDEFRRMQLSELELLVEFDRVCRKHDIKYVISSGTMLGAVRHKGFIPWDDDADLMMLREDYERFKSVVSDLDPDICFFQDHTTDPNYRWGYGKLRRTGTEYVRLGQEHLTCKTGIFVDVFAYDDVPKTTLGQWIQDKYCFCCRKILWSEVAKKNTKGIARLWFSLLSLIPTRTVFKMLSCYSRKSRNSSPNLVRCLCIPSIGTYFFKHPLKVRFGIPKKWFTETAEYEFEGKKLIGTKDYDECLTFWYGDYMKLPPEDQREQHAPVSYIDFGDSPKDYKK